MKFANAACSVLSNEDLLRILAELEKPFRYDPFSGIPVVSSLDILGLPQAEGFAPSTTSLSPSQQRLKASVLAAKKPIVNRIEENTALVRERKRMKDQAAQKDINNLIKQLSSGNDNPGIGTRRIKGLKNESEARGRNEGRVYFREKNGKIEILATSNKDNQNRVIGILQKMGY